ncbi:MAG: hypothetical protein ACREV1_00885 [Gammaproteobacteria bacterium]
MKAAIARGAIPFEIISGVPLHRYGARITFRPGPEPQRLAAVAGLAGHPWGLPDAIGLRVSPTGTACWKGYHRLTELDGRFTLPQGLPKGFDPVMASLDGAATELYLRFCSACLWTPFAAQVAALLGHPVMPFHPHPRPAEGGFCLSLRWQAEQLSAVTLYADARSLPNDTTVATQWPQGMDAAERSAYEIAFAGARAAGPRRPRGWHAMLAWTLERGGAWHRAASLRVPLPEEAGKHWHVAIG